MSEFEWTLPNRLRADFLHGEVAIWNTLPEAATEIERLLKALMDIRQVAAGPAQHDIAVAECFDIATKAINCRLP